MTSKVQPSGPKRSHLLWHAIAILAIVILVIVMVSGASASRNRPLKVIVPFGAGGGSDSFVRIIQKAITDEGLLDRPFVIINQKGGSQQHVVHHRLLLSFQLLLTFVIQLFLL